jgi:hypothetical protein
MDLTSAGPLMGCIEAPAITITGAKSGPFSLVPAVIMSVRAKPALVEEALRAGAHQVLVLPTTASTLYRRLDWIINDDRPFELKATITCSPVSKRGYRSASSGRSMSRPVIRSFLHIP